MGSSPKAECRRIPEQLDRRQMQARSVGPRLASPSSGRRAVEKGRCVIRCSASLIHMFALPSQLMLSGEMAKWHRGHVVLVRSTSPLAAGPQPPRSKVTRTFELFFSINAFRAHPAACLGHFRSTMDRFIASRGGIGSAHHSKTGYFPAQRVAAGQASWPTLSYVQVSAST